jgi:hypothetical protein
VTALGLVLAAMGGCDDSSDSDPQQPVKPADVTETARAVKESAQAANAIVRLNTATADPTSAAPAVDPSGVDPTGVDGADGGIIGSILEVIFDAL